MIEHANQNSHPNTDPHPPAVAHDPTLLVETDTLAAVLTWARPFLVGDAPAFGSPEWVALAPEDPRVAASVVRAALGWYRAGEPLDALEQAEAAQALKAAVAAAGPYGSTPTHAELTRRRALPAQRDQDHPGGAVASW